MTFPCPWGDDSAERLPSGATGLVHEGQLHGFVVGKFGDRYTACLRKLAVLGLPFVELHFKERNGLCASHGMIWREAR